MISARHSFVIVLTWCFTYTCYSFSPITRTTLLPFTSGNHRSLKQSTRISIWSKLIPSFNCEQFPNTAKAFFPVEADYTAYCSAHSNMPTLRASDYFDFGMEFQTILLIGVVIYGVSRLPPAWSDSTRQAFEDLQDELDKEAYLEERAESTIDEEDEDNSLDSIVGVRSKQMKTQQGYKRSGPKAVVRQFRTCPQCDGSGVFLKSTCDLCSGSGKIIETFTDELPSYRKQTSWFDDDDDEEDDDEENEDDYDSDITSDTSNSSNSNSNRRQSTRNYSSSPQSNRRQIDRDDDNQ